eukprot:CAMPEP_0173179422 /NCGR_PEP_ID=MMETSP1141-20130122/6105_1 /TAXON_ID=483371 /ORGANISM="non described non described, Strain CCMP2298" /LENGTH=87 /DNA_ID=CAMNT_0014102067 /DNA_START=102 /DNA_END=365 /DNA_ORIENTATION=-
MGTKVTAGPTPAPRDTTAGPGHRPAKPQPTPNNAAPVTSAQSTVRFAGCIPIFKRVPRDWDWDFERSRDWDFWDWDSSTGASWACMK